MELLSTYRQWKNWEGTGPVLSPQLEAYFDSETKELNLIPSSRVLEIGFGNGEFLLWCFKKGVSAHGVEIIPECVAAVKQFHPNVYHLDLTLDAASLQAASGWADLVAEKFNAVVAFDVFEHLEVDKLKVLLQNLSSLVKEGGIILARVPNGGSPFALPLYNGDLTHRLWLSPSSVRQLAEPIGFKVQFTRNARRMKGKSILAPLRIFSPLINSLFEVILAFLYYGKRVPLAPNLIFGLSKADKSLN